MNDGEYQDGEIRGLEFMAGDRGMGKTTEMIRLTEQCTGAVIFFDSVGTHVHKLPRAFKQFNQPGPLLEYMRINYGRRIQVLYVPRDEWPEKHCTAVCSMIRAFGQDFERKGRDDLGYILCLDEIDLYCGSKWGDERMPRPLYNLAQYGRHYHVSMLCTAREPKTLSPRFRSQCATMRLFQTSEDGNLDYFKGRIGRLNVEKLPLIPKTYYLLWKAGERDAQVAGGPRKLLRIA